MAKFKRAAEDDAPSWLRPPEGNKWQTDPKGRAHGLVPWPKEKRRGRRRRRRGRRDHGDDMTRYRPKKRKEDSGIFRRPRRTTRA